jgi:hypothetical protein
VMTNEDTLGGSRPAARLLTVDQVAELLQISRWSVSRLIWVMISVRCKSDGAADERIRFN